MLDVLWDEKLMVGVILWLFCVFHLSLRCLIGGRWLLVVGCWSLVVGRWLLVVGCWLLVVGCWLLVVGCWLLVVGCFIKATLYLS
jgi:hypothetical protein